MAAAQTTTTTTSSTSYPVITSPLTASGKVGVDFRYQVTATNKPTKYNFWVYRNKAVIGSSTSGLTGDTTTGLLCGQAEAGRKVHGLRASRQFDRE